MIDVKGKNNDFKKIAKNLKPVIFIWKKIRSKFNKEKSSIG